MVYHHFFFAGCGEQGGVRRDECPADPPADRPAGRRADRAEAEVQGHQRRAAADIQRHGPELLKFFYHYSTILLEIHLYFIDSFILE